MSGPSPVQPPPMSRGKALGYAVGLPVMLVCLLFIPAGSIAWTPGWVFVLVFFAAIAACTLAMRRLNPVIFQARSRFQPGTQSWDLKIVSIVLVAMAAIVPVAALDAGRLKLYPLPLWVIVVGYVLFLAGIAIMTWAQAVNEFFEPGVRIQSERHHRVIDSGPYAFIRHPGYISAIGIFAGMALALGSLLALVPALIASIALAVRTGWEDQMLRNELPGYQDYARRVRWRLLPGIW